MLCPRCESLLVSPPHSSLGAATRQVHGVRVQMVEALKKEFPDMGLSYVIGETILTRAGPLLDKVLCGGMAFSSAACIQHLLYQEAFRNCLLVLLVLLSLPAPPTHSLSLTLTSLPLPLTPCPSHSLPVPPTHLPAPPTHSLPLPLTFLPLPLTPCRWSNQH